MLSANIFDIKRFGINDGDGIRTVLFLKGCPLRCQWCQNPEGLFPDIRVWHWMETCVSCQSCVAACGQQAICFDEAGLLIDQERCTLCGECVRTCPTGAIRFDGKRMTVDQVMEELEKDRVFYGENGGVTLSGGDPLASPDFSLAVLEECRARGIHTAIETCLYASREYVEAFAEATDQIIADIKLIDPERHLAVTGVDNGLILGNINSLIKLDCDLLLRVPLISGYTADRENLEGIAQFISSQPRPVPVQLLNFNPMCREKYRSLRLDDSFLQGQRAFTQVEMLEFQAVLEAYGLHVI